MWPADKLTSLAPRSARVLLSGYMECVMREINIERDGCRRANGDARTVPVDAQLPFTPSQFFWEAGLVIAVCLGLALLGHVIVACAGPY
jgi:hypothetical protein